MVLPLPKLPQLTQRAMVVQLQANMASAPQVPLATMAPLNPAHHKVSVTSAAALSQPAAVVLAALDPLDIVETAGIEDKAWPG